MTYEAHYPDQRSASPLTTVYRHCFLPDEAVGTLRTSEGKRVDARDVVANGVAPSRHIIIEAARILRLRKPEQLEDLMQVNVGDVVEEKQFLAGKNPKRGKRVFAPSAGVVTHSDQWAHFTSRNATSDRPASRCAWTCFAGDSGARRHCRIGWCSCTGRMGEQPAFHLHFGD